MLTLRYPYTQIRCGEVTCYGGDQRRLDRKELQSCGCGVVAAADTLIYLRRRHSDFRSRELDEFVNVSHIDMDSYNSLIGHLNRRYFPLIPGKGINGLMLMAGMNRFFFKNALPYKARWCLSNKNIWTNIERQLAADIPVIISIGPNFPRVWNKESAALYTKSDSGEYIKSFATNAHYVTVTGIDGQWLRVSSWGGMYYISRREFEDYTRLYSAPFLCNILQIY